MTDRTVTVTADLTLPVYKVIEKREHMTSEEAIAFYDNDPVAGTEFREMATLFLQMHDLICGLVPDSLPGSLPGSRGIACAPEALRILQGRSQALVDKTRNFTRPIRT
jgi:hypothetical protein